MKDKQKNTGGKKADKDIKDSKELDSGKNTPFDASEQKSDDDESKILELKEKLSTLEQENKGLLNKLQRLAAEFDNFKKRTLKEKDNIYSSAVVDVVSSFLPVIDNLERALAVSSSSDNKTGTDKQSILEGVQMVYRQMNDILEKLGIKAIDAVGTAFDPELHEAVMHVKDENFGEGEIIEEFQKGYIYKDEIVIRHSMVKVAN